MAQNFPSILPAQGNYPIPGATGWERQTDRHLTDLQNNDLYFNNAFGQLQNNQAATDNRLGNLENFQRYAGTSLAELRSFETSTNDRFGQLDTRVSNLENGKLAIKDYDIDKKAIEKRLDRFDAFEKVIGDAWQRDIPKIGKRLDDLEKGVAALETKTKETDKDISGIRKKIEENHNSVTSKLTGMEKKQDDCCKSVKKLIGELTTKIGSASDKGSGGVRGDCNGSSDFANNWDGVNYRSPQAVNVRFNNRGDISFNPVQPQLPSSSSSFSSPSFSSPSSSQPSEGNTFLPSPFVIPTAIVPISVWSSPPSRSHSRSRSRSRDRGRGRLHRSRHSVDDNRSGDFNQGPSIHFGLTRQSGGGMFSKPTVDTCSLGMIGGYGSSGSRRGRRSGRVLELS